MILNVIWEWRWNEKFGVRMISREGFQFSLDFVGPGGDRHLSVTFSRVCWRCWISFIAILWHSVMMKRSIRCNLSDPNTYVVPRCGVRGVALDVSAARRTVVVRVRAPVSTDSHVQVARLITISTSYVPMERSLKAHSTRCAVDWLISQLIWSSNIIAFSDRRKQNYNTLLLFINSNESFNPILRLFLSGRYWE